MALMRLFQTPDGKKTVGRLCATTNDVMSILARIAKPGEVFFIGVNSSCHDVSNAKSFEITQKIVIREGEGNIKMEYFNLPVA